MDINYREFMLRAYREALNSPDPSTQNGAVLVRPNLGLIGVGCNNFPYGVDQKHWVDRDAKYLRVVHAEVAALLNAARTGKVTVGSTLVCPWAACSNCAKHIAAAGVTRLIRHKFSNNGVTTGSHWYDDCLIGDEIMTEAGVEIIEVEPLKTDIQLRRNGSLWPQAEQTTS